MEGLEDRRLLTFLPAVSFPAGDSPQAIVSADFNNDGRLDLATANADTVSVLLGNVDGTFQSPVTTAAAAGLKSLAVGDFNNDGKLDLAMVNDYAISYYGNTDPDPSNGLSVMLGNGDGSFQAPANVPLNHGAKATSVAVGDFNVDGTMDLAVASVIDPYYPGDVYEDRGLANVLLGNGDGSFQIQSGTGVDRGYGISRPTPAAVAVAVADFNGDGHLDFVVGTRNFSFETGDTVEEVAMLLGDGQGNIASESWWRLDHGWSMAAGDLDGDGDADLVTASGSQVHVRLGNGIGGFEAPPGGQTYAAGPGAFEVVLGDFNRDGKLDIATANTVGGDVSVLRGRGDGTFGSPERFAAGSSTSGIAAGDFNGDGWLDVAAADSGGTTVSVLVNDQTWPGATVTIGDATVTEGNAGTVTASFTVRLSSASTAQVTVRYVTADGTAAAGSDYQAASGTLTFAPGETSKTITVLVKGDRLVEPNEAFAVNLTAATNASIADGQAVGTIVDDEPHISISDVTRTEGNGKKTTLFVFTITLSAAYDQPVTMSFQTLNGTATTSDNDYVAKSGTLTFNPGETTKAITIEVKGDNKKETTEYFYLDLFGLSSNAQFTKNRGLGTILNND